MTWIQTYTGRCVYPLALSCEDLCVDDIAWSLSMQCRYTGHCQRFYSVAEHSIYCAEQASLLYESNEMHLAALLHDASEAYLVDVPRPIKPVLFGYTQIEDRTMRVIAKWARFSFDLLELIKPIDEAVLASEAQVLMPNPPQTWQLKEEPIDWVVEAVKSDRLTDQRVVFQTFKTMILKAIERSRP